MDETVQTEVGRMLLLAAVQRAITCPYTQRVLDIGDAVLIDIENEDGKTVDMNIMVGSHWDKVNEPVQRAANAAGLQLTVYDGRVLNS